MNFTCPHCSLPQIATEKASGSFTTIAYVGRFAEMTDRGKGEFLHVSGNAVCCANVDCKRISVGIVLASGYHQNSSTRRIEGSEFLSQRLYPGAVGKPFPEHVPKPMLDDYQEAWSIIDLSPKSSATLARRCLQAMIRDFCGIKKRTLFDEIEALRKLSESDSLPRGVDPDTIGAMLALKDVGNIGAHMSEIDGVILDVDPDEAQNLLGLIEMLFADWYVARGKRAERIAAVHAVAESKKSKPTEG